MADQETLKQFMNLLWLRPESAVLRTARSTLIDKLDFSGRGADLSCGDGISSFVYLGGRIDSSFDVFEGASSLARTRESADMFDSWSDSYLPPITRAARFQYEYGADLKDNSMKRAQALGLYRNFVGFDALKEIQLSTAGFDMITCYSAINHFPRVDLFLEEVRRLLAPGGKFILVAIAPTMIKYYKDAEMHYPESWVSLIERNMRRDWPTMMDWREWQDLLASKGFKVESLQGAGNGKAARLWNIGFRPLAPELIRLRNIALKSAPQELLEIKQGWVDVLCKLSQPFLQSANDLDDAADYVFVLS